MRRRSPVARMWLFGLALLAGLPAAAAAQGLRSRPSTAECAAWAQGLAAGGEDAEAALAFGWLAACDGGAVVLSDALRTHAGDRDAAFLFHLASQAAQVRDSRVLDAALDVAGDQRATHAARAAAILVLVAQAGSSWDYPGVTGAQLLTEPLPGAGICGPAPSGRGFATDNGLPPDHRRQIAAVLDHIGGQGGPPLLRHLARCSRPVLGVGIPPQIDVTRVTLRNVCGTTFRVHNTTPEHLVFSFAVVGTGESGDLTVEARSQREFTTANAGTVQLLYDGRVIQTAPSGERPCR